MRILFPYLARWYSANWTRYHHLLTALARRGHQVTVLQPPLLPGAMETNFLEMPEPSVPPERPVPGIDLVEVQVPSMVWNARLPMAKPLKKSLAAWSARSTVTRLGAEGRVDVLLLYNIAQAAFVDARARCVLVDVADDLLAMFAQEMPDGLRAMARPAATAAFRRLLGAADVVTTSSSVLAERLGPRARVIPNGVDAEAVARADGTAIRSRYRAPLIGYVGAFEYFVDFDLVLDTAAGLPECEFLLVGGGRLWSGVTDAARRRSLSNVHFPGPVAYREALDYMAAFDVAMLPFRPGPVADAASPLKLFEYLALRRPVISTPALEVNRIAGPWVRFGRTSDDWIGAIHDVIGNPGQALRRTAAGRDEVLARYRWDRIAAEMEALFQPADVPAGR